MYSAVYSVLVYVQLCVQTVHCNQALSRVTSLHPVPLPLAGREIACWLKSHSHHDIRLLIPTGGNALYRHSSLQTSQAAADTVSSVRTIHTVAAGIYKYMG